MVADVRRQLEDMLNGMEKDTEAMFLDNSNKGFCVSFHAIEHVLQLTPHVSGRFATDCNPKGQLDFLKISGRFEWQQA